MTESPDILTATLEIDLSLEPSGSNLLDTVRKQEIIGSTPQQEKQPDQKTDDVITQEGEKSLSNEDNTESLETKSSPPVAFLSGNAYLESKRGKKLGEKKKTASDAIYVQIKQVSKPRKTRHPYLNPKNAQRVSRQEKRNQKKRKSDYRAREALTHRTNKQFIENAEQLKKASKKVKQSKTQTKMEQRASWNPYNNLDIQEKS